MFPGQPESRDPLFQDKLMNHAQGQIFTRIDVFAFLDIQSLKYFFYHHEKTMQVKPVDTYKRSICNVQSRRIASSYNAQKCMHRNKINNECVTSPRADLNGGHKEIYK